MRQTLRSIAAALAVSVLGSAPAWAEDLALIVVNSSYASYADLGGSRAIKNLRAPLRQAGYDVALIENTRRGASAQQTDALWARIAEADRLFIVLAGHVVETGGRAWLLHSDARAANALNIGAQGLPVRAFLTLAAERPGDAVIALAGSTRAIETGPGVTHGFRIRGIPQGVTVVSGGPTQLAAFISQELLRSGTSVAAAAAASGDDVSVTGYLPPYRAVVGAYAPAPAPSPAPDPNQSFQIERSYWQFAERQNVPQAYQEYLNRFPNGRFADEARRRIADLTLTPQDRARLAEEALGLDRNQRRKIQRELTLLGFDTRGVDGLLGRNSRNAIGRWQQSINLTVTGYLTANQITRIEAAAALRAEELRIEAEERRRRAERQDRTYWAQTGANGTEAGLRVYLEKYPDGLFSQPARDQLKAIEREQRRRARAEERQAWDQAAMANSVASYQAYLQRYPQGLFATEASARIAAMQNPETPQNVIDAAEQEERRLSLNGFTRQLIEAQLQALQLDPGKVDGKFTKATRRALRNYQRATNQPVTGFVTRDTIVRLLAAAIE